MPRNKSEKFNDINDPPESTAEKPKSISKEKLKKYIQKYLDKNYTPTYLKKFLLDQGYDNELIERAYFEIGLKTETELVEKLEKLKINYLLNYLRNLPTWAYYIVAIIAVLSILALLYPAEDISNNQLDSQTFAVKDCSQDKNCFIAEAKKCNDAVYQQPLEGSIVEFSSSKIKETKESESNNCVIKKRFKSFAESEPKEIKDLFKDLEMTCSYKKESFDAALANDLIAGIETCDGLLKDAIYELRIAQIELEAAR